jgi:hypothetical protein
VLQDEIRAIVQKRKDFEYLLVRRSPEKADFLRYIAYELSLDALRIKRKARLGMHAGMCSFGSERYHYHCTGIKHTMDADHGAVRTVHLLFDRALRRFKADPAMWLQWVDFAMRSDGGKALAKIFPQALQLLPRSVDLWLQAAGWSFDGQGAVAEARMYLQRGLRVNPSSQRLWLAYFRLECLYILRVRARRSLLGLDATATAEGASEMEEVAATPTGAAAHKAAFMAGAVPQVVFSRAAQALPTDVHFKAAFLASLRAIAAAFDSAAQAEADNKAAKGEEQPPLLARSVLFPQLHAHILSSIMKQHATEAAAWAVLAGSVLAPARAAVARSTASGGAATEELAAGTSTTHSVAATLLAAGSESSVHVEATSVVDGALKRPKAGASLQDVLAAWAAAGDSAILAQDEEQDNVAAAQLLQQAESKAFGIMDRAVAACGSPETHTARCSVLHSQMALKVPGASAGRHSELLARLLQCTTQANEAGCATGFTVLLHVAALQAAGRHQDALAAAAVASTPGAGTTSYPETWLVYAGVLAQRELVQRLHIGAHGFPDSALLQSDAGHRSPLAVLLAGCAAVPSDAVLPVMAATLTRACTLYSTASNAPGSELHSAVASFSAASTAGREYAQAVTGVPAACPPALASVAQLFLHVLYKCPREVRQHLQLQMLHWLAQAHGTAVLLLLAGVVTAGGASLAVHESILAQVAAPAHVQSETAQHSTAAVFDAALREHGAAAPALWAQYVKWLRASLKLTEASAAYDQALRSLGAAASAFVEVTAE